MKWRLDGNRYGNLASSDSGVLWVDLHLKTTLAAALVEYNETVISG